MNTTCTVNDCGKPERGNTGLCYGHYMKRWRYGTATPDHGIRYADLTGQRFGMVTVIARVDGRWECECDCGKRTIVRVGDLYRASENRTCGDRAHRRLDKPTYGGAHSRVKRAFGSASAHPCVDCSGIAAQWSYDRTDPDELIENGLPYSADPKRYAARCVPCHKAFDLAAIGRPA